MGNLVNENCCRNCSRAGFQARENNFPGNIHPITVGVSLFGKMQPPQLWLTRRSRGINFPELEFQLWSKPITDIQQKDGKRLAKVSERRILSLFTIILLLSSFWFSPWGMVESGMLRRSGEGVVDDFSKRGSLSLSDVSCFVGRLCRR